MSITLGNPSTQLYTEEPEQLIKALHSWGIHYLMGETGSARKAANRLPPLELIKRLARCEYPRIRDASISLFLLHPELAERYTIVRQQLALLS